MEYLYNCIRQQIISIALRSTDKKAHMLKFNNGNANRMIKGATSRFVHLEKFSLNFSSWSFAIRVNLLHP